MDEPSVPPGAGARLRRALAAIRSLLAGPDGADQEGLLAERTLQQVRRSPRRRERPSAQPGDAGDDDR